MTSLSDLDDGSSIQADRSDASVIGAGVAAAICFVIATFGSLLTPEGWVFGILGLPATTYLAWRVGPRVVAAEGRRSIRPALLLGIETIILSDALVAFILVAATFVSVVGAETSVGVGDPVTSIVGALGFGLLVFVFGAILWIPAAIVVLPAALVWAALVRHLTPRDPGADSVADDGSRTFDIRPEAPSGRS